MAAGNTSTTAELYPYSLGRSRRDLESNYERLQNLGRALGGFSMSFSWSQGGQQTSQREMKQGATLIRARSKTPRAAAIAGILFSVLLITGLLLFRLSVRAD